jgi:osmotically-inducible protein OsmY
MHLRLLFILIITLPLYGCVASASVSGAQAMYNRHNLQKNFDDSYLTLDIRHAIKSDESLSNANISVAVFNRVVLLTGQTPKAGQRKNAEEIAKGIPGVQQVYNFITISPPSSTLIQTSDAWITTKVKSKLIAANEVDPSKIKVVTEDGTVYLMGIVLPSQAEAAVYLASTTDGVQNVVKIFSYLKICKKM